MDFLPHEKIRFRRDEIADLGNLPSAAIIDPAVLDRPRRLRRLRLATIVCGGVLVVLTVAVATVSWLMATGVASDRLQAELERAVGAALGEGVDAQVGRAAIGFDYGSLLSVAVDDISVSTEAGDGRLVEAGKVRFDVAILPLLLGRIELGDARIADARVNIDRFPSSDDSNSFADAILDDRGLVDPDRVLDAVFASLNGVFDALRASPAHRLGIENLTVAAEDSGALADIRISNAVFDGTEQAILVLSVEGTSDLGSFSLTGNAAQRAGRIENLDLELMVDEPISPEPAAAGATRSRIGTARIAIDGGEHAGGQPPRLSIDAKLDDGFLDLGTQGAFTGGATLKAVLEKGSGKLEIGELQLSTGQSIFQFNGAVGPKPATTVADFEAPAYRYELVSDRTIVSPLDSPEARVEAQMRIAGRYVPASSLFSADEILISAGDGLLRAQSTFNFKDAGAPGVFLDMSVEDMPVTHVKQLWPWFAGAGARRWVLQNFFGGEVVSGSVRYDVKPGRIGSGVPLAPEEVYGRFEVADSRFDTAGAIPAIRDADGVVQFAGNDVDISLSTGRVYLPSGLRVDASNGKLAIKDANRPPVVGKLDIDVAGDARAVAELASLEPIDAMRHVGIAPAEFSGRVTGNVKADIPLQKGIDPKTLAWRVALDVDGLGVAKPLDGQKLTDADGTIIVDREKAVVKLNGKLNGVPAEIALVEPVGRSAVKSERVIDLVLDDAAREALVPGLSAMISGSVKVRVDAAGSGPRRFTADLTRARVAVPWAGWEKGPGIGADLSFTLASSNGNAKLSDFVLEGDTFSVRGDIGLSNGRLSTAKFSRARLNRGDSVAVSVNRRGGGYDVDISGDALDARAAIKQFLSDADTAGRSAGSDRVRVNAAVGKLSGFNGEVLNDVTLGYSSGDAPTLTVKAKTGTGRSVSITNGPADGSQQVSMVSDDAGSILRFLDIYKHMEGGSIDLRLTGAPGTTLKGKVDARNFWVVDEPKLRSMVSTAPSGGDRSLNDAVRSDIDTSRVRFERGFAEIAKSKGSLQLGRGVLRGPLIGMSFQGTLYDRRNRMEMTGTFMPAYGLNRIFGELPLIGAILGNGRDRGLIGVTFKLEGDANKPELRINPLSVIAPGIFRSIFEYQ